MTVVPVVGSNWVVGSPTMVVATWIPCHKDPTEMAVSAEPNATATAT